MLDHLRQLPAHSVTALAEHVTELFTQGDILAGTGIDLIGEMPRVGPLLLDQVLRLAALSGRCSWATENSTTSPITS